MTAKTTSQDDLLHLRRALELAVRGRGRVSPNPLVGAILVRDSEVLGQGFHAELGGAHAEVAAIDDCRTRGHDPAGATLYVTLEPCAHRGRTPPCTEAILAAGIGRVVIASEDPSEKASGRGPGILRDEGVEVALAQGAEASAARLLNQPFRKHARSGRPQVTLKAALSLDGFIATETGDSRWISGEPSRALVHRWRAEADAIAVGIGTVLADDPLLTARDTGTPNPRQPLRVVFDSGARLPLDSQLARTAADGPVLVVCGPGAAAERRSALDGAGIETAVVAGEPPERVVAGLAELGRRGVTSLLLEGGAGLNAAFLAAGEVDEMRLFYAPLVLGGGRPLAQGESVATIAAGQRPLAVEVERSGEDVLISARLREW